MMQITERDREILYWINKHGFVTAKQTCYFFNRKKSVIYKRLKFLVDNKLLKNGRIFSEQRGLYWVTAAGAKICDSNLLSIGDPKPLLINHDLRVVDVSLYLKNKYNGTWVTARELKSRMIKNELTRIGSSKFILNKLNTRVADGVLKTADGDYAVEVELTLKSKTRIKKIISDYAQQIITKKIIGVIYVTNKNSIILALQEEIKRTMVAEKFDFIMIGDEKDGRPIFRYVNRAERTSEAVL